MATNAVQPVWWLAPRPAPAPVQQEPAAAGELEGGYRGTVNLGVVVAGRYSDPLATPTPNPAGTPTPSLGDIDFGLILHQTGSQVEGNVDLDATMIFTRTGIVVPSSPATPIAVGPRVSGAYDGTTLTLVSDPVDLVTTTGVRWVRQFRLVGTRMSGDRDVFEGEYRETFTEEGSEPITLIGKFTLSSTTFVAPTPTTGPTSTPTSPPGATSTPTATPGLAGENKSYLPLMQRP